MANERDEFNRGGLYAFIFSMVFVLGFMFYLVAIQPGVNLDEKVVDPHAKSAGGEEKPAFNMAAVKEPWIATPEIIEYGHKLFLTNCSMCHGNEGKGDGPAGAGLNPKPRNMVEGKWTQGSGVIAHFKVVTNGIPGTSMAAFKHFKVGDRWAIALFVESITTNKGNDTPAQLAEFGKTAQ